MPWTACRHPGSTVADVVALHAPPTDWPSGTEGGSQSLDTLIDYDFLRGLGWDEQSQLIRLPPEHPVVGWKPCRNPLCQVMAARRQQRQGFCDGCDLRRLSRGMTAEEFLTAGESISRVGFRGEDTRPCRVPDCQRPIRDRRLKLCNAHLTHVKLTINTHATEDDVQTFLASGNAKPLPSWGECRVACCDRVAGNPKLLCYTHRDRWVRHLKVHPETPFDHWCATTSSISESGVINLRALPDRLRLQVLLAVQIRVKANVRTHIHGIHVLVDWLRSEGYDDLLEPTQARNDLMRLALQSMQNDLRLAMTNPDAEQVKDVWNMQVFGARGTIDFTVLSQPWLRAITKFWVLQELPTRRGADIAAALRDHVNSVAALSIHLRLARDDHGLNPAAVTRKDLMLFLNHLAHREREGRMSTYHRSRIIRNIRTVLRDSRDLGLARSGGPIELLPAEVSIRVEDIPAALIHTTDGKALPVELFDALRSALADLETACGTAVRTAVELLMDTGRRPDEICRLPFHCLDTDTDGKSVLVYTDHKQNRADRRLPISDAIADRIREQQHRVRAQYRDTPLEHLPLLPARIQNPLGKKSIRATTLTNFHHDWIQRQPPFVLRDGTEFPRSRIIPYAYRHSFAQRHADAGTPVDVLRDLMGHRHFASTQTYYRITEKRTREAVDRLAAHQLDGAGHRIWRTIDGLLDTERARQRIGEVAVPFGNCTEPSNVRAGGGACPFRFRCTGCGHFRTDASYLPELRSYLDQLLTNRERVRAASELDEWARTEATPSDTEIHSVRTLIHRVEQDLDDLDPKDRAQLLKAVDVVRSARPVVHLGLPQVTPPRTGLQA